MSKPNDTWIELNYHKEMELQHIKEKWTGQLLYYTNTPGGSKTYIVIYPFTGFVGAGRAHTLKESVDTANKSVEYALKGRRSMEDVPN